jgi:PKD repeat protein
MGLVGGSYDVTIIYNGTLNACETGFRFSVLDPSAVTGIIGADEVCLNVPYQYSVAAPQASGRYDWAVTGATVAILSGSTIQVEFTSAGTKSLEVTYTEFADDGSTCTSPPLTKQIETLISPPDDIAGPDAPCPDSRSTYSVLFSGATQYQWSILDNNGSVTPLGSVVEGQGTNVIDVQWLQVSVVTPVIIQLTYILCPGGTAVVKDYNVLITPFELALDGPAEICEGEEAMFTLNIDPANNNQGNATWYVDGILIVNGPPVNRNFEIPGEPGLHEVSVIVTDGNGCPGVTQATVTINVISSPNPTISLSTPDICDKNGNVVVDLLVTPSNAESYVWTTPSGQIDQGTNPELPVTEVGVYTVTVTNSNCTGVASITVEKEPNVACECEIPDANDITVEIINATSSGCSTISVVGNSNITDGRPGSVFWRLQGPNGQSELSSVINEDDLFETFSVSLPGRYFIYLVASEQCSDMMSSCSERAVAIVDIPFTPDFSANFSCATSTMGTYDLILEDQSLYSSVADLELVSWKINWPGMTASPTGQNVTLSDLPGGTTVNVCQTLESTNGYSCDECRDVTIPNDIMGDFTYDNMADCTGEIIDFVPQIDATEVESILWNFGDGTTSQILMPSKVYNMAGDYTVTLTLTSVFGCDFVSTRTVTVSTPSVMSGQIEAVSDFCETTASLSFQTSDMSPVMYEWSTGETTASIEATISGVYSLTVTDESGCSYIPDPVGVTIIESFLSEISNPGEVCSGEMFSAFVFSSGINKTIYRWEVSNEEGTVEPVGSGTSFNASLTDAGTYTISFILEREGVVCQSVETTIVVHPAPDQPIITDVTQCNPFSTILTTQYAGIDWSTNRQPPFVTASSITAARSNLTYWGTVSNDFGCSAEASFTGDFPDLDMFQSGCFTLCSDSLIGLTLDGIPGSFTSWEWVLTNPETGIEEIIEGGTGEITPLILSEVSEGEITLRIVFGDCTLETESFCMKLEDCDTECFLEEDDFKIAAMDCYLNDPTLSDYYVFYLSGRIDLPNGYDLCEEDQSILSYPLGTADWTSFRIRGNSNGMRLELAGFYYIPVADYETYQTEGFSIIVELCDAAGNICLLPVNVSSMECGSLTVECEIGEIKADCVSWPGRDPVCFLQYTNNLYFVTGPSCDITDWTVESYGRTASGERVLLQVDYVSGTPIESRSYTQVAYMSEADYGSYVSYEVLTYHNCQTSDDACVRTLNTSKGSKSLAIQEAQVPSLTLFPNPTTSLLTVDVGTQQVIDQYTVLTLSGKQVAMDDGVKKTSTTFSVSSMPPGVYMVRLVTTDGSVYTRRFVVAR